MIYSHIVKLNGVWYPAGTNVPAGHPAAAEFERESSMVMSDEYDSDNVGVESVAADDIQTEFKKSDILNMRKADLISLAEENGISEAAEMTAAKLKTALIEVFGL